MSDYCYRTQLTLYKDRDNAITIVPYSNMSESINYDMTAVTKVVANADLATSTVVGDSIVGDSSVTQAVYWDDLAVVDGVPQWRIYCKIGLFTGIVAGEYILRITIFDPDHPNGLVLPGMESSLRVTIADLP